MWETREGILYLSAEIIEFCKVYRTESVFESMVNQKPNKTVPVMVIFLLPGLLMSACQKLELDRLVKIRTGDFLNLTSNSVTLTGELVDVRKEGVLQYGLCWSNFPNPTPVDNQPSWGWTTEAKPFQVDITGLTWNTTYYYRAYCKISESEYMFGEEHHFRTPYDAVFRHLPANVTPVLDGQIDDIWNTAEKHYIERDFHGTHPTIDSAYWKAVWNNTTLFILVAVYDDVHIDQWDINENNWDADKPEIYIDVNSILKDGLGTAEDYTVYPHEHFGHYQFADSWAKDTSILITSKFSGQDIYYKYAYCLTDPDYVFEYAIEWYRLEDKNGNAFDPLQNNREFGFDVCIIDRDAKEIPRSFKVWRNAGRQDAPETETYDYYNMDGAGVVVLSKDQ
jgi:hypothetical protein